MPSIRSAKAMRPRAGIGLTLDGDAPRYVVGRNYITEEVEVITG